MLFVSSQKYLILQLKLCSFFCAIPVYWNSKRNSLCALESPRRLIYEIMVILHCAHVLFLLCSAVYQEEHNMSTKLIKWNSTMLLVSSVVFHIGSWENSHDIAHLLSVLNKFEENHISSIGGQIHPIEKMVMMMSSMSTAAFPLIMGTTVWLEPCLPPFVGSLILECIPQSHSGESQHSPPPPPVMIIRLLLCIFAMWTWTISASVSMMYFSCILFLTTGCLNTYLVQLKRNMIPKYVYREVQILTTLLNNIQRKLMLPNLQIISTITPVVCMYCCINLHHIISKLTLAFCIIILFDVLLCHYFVFGSAAQVFQNSSRCVEKWRRESKCFAKRGKLRHFQHSFAASCSPLRIRFGSLNFIGILTPLRIINFWIATTVKLSVMWGQH